jgi:subtilisin family serine protease
MAKKSSITPAHGNPAFALRGARPVDRGGKESGAVVIRFKPGAVAPPAVARRGARVAGGFEAMPAAIGEPLRWLKDNFGLSKVRPLFAAAAPAAASRGLHATKPAARAALAVHESVHDAPLEALRGYSVAQLDPRKVNDKLLRDLSNANGIEFAERLPRRWLTGTGSRRARTDPERNNQWGLRAIGWFDARLPSAAGVEVGILDSGIDTTHPDLKRIVAGYDDGGFSAEDLIGHGTHVGGIVAAVANNGVGITGVANCRLRVWKVFSDTPDDDGELFTDDETYLRALGHAAASQVRVVNLSLGGFEASRTERALIKTIVDRGKVVVAAMGNEFEEGNPTEYPAAYSNVISVGAIGVSMRRAAFSNTGRHISLVAPGKHILSTLPMKGSPFRAPDEIEYAFWDGTSMAAPCVAGCIALAFARQPSLDGAALLAAIPRVIRKIGAMKGKSFTREFGHGLVHLPTLLQVASAL